MRCWFHGLGTAAVVCLLFALGAASASADAGPFDCTTPTIFALSLTTNQLFTAPQSSATTGAPAFTALGSPYQLQPTLVYYNALGYNPADGYVWGLTYINGSPVSLVRIDRTGNATVLPTPVAGLPGEMADGAFAPDGYLWVIDGGVMAYAIDVTQNKVVKTLTLNANFNSADWTYSDGYMWGVSQGVVTRVDLNTGTVTEVALPGLSTQGTGFGGWTFANGDIGFMDNAGSGSPLYYRIHLTLNGDGSFTPTIVGSGDPIAGVVAGAGDATSCNPPVTVASTPLADGAYGTAGYSAQLSASGGSGGYQFSFAGGSLPPGLVLNGDGSITGTPTAAGAYTFDVTATDSSGNPSAPQAETITIDKVDLTVEPNGYPNPVDIHYGDPAPEFTPVYDGLVNGDTAPSAAVSCTSDYVPGSPVGTGFTESCTTPVDPNYNIISLELHAAVVAAPLTVEVVGSQTYGDSTPTFQSTYAGFQNGDDAHVVHGALSCTAAVTPSTPAGSYPSGLISCGGLSADNYDVVYEDDGFTVGRAPVTVTAWGGSMTYGGTPPAITASYSGLQNGDQGPATAPTCSTTATSASPVGSYPSSCSGADDPNYTFSYTPGSVSVGAAPVQVTASGGTMTYGGTPPAITASYSGLQNGASAPATAPSCSTLATSSSPVGSYASSCTGADDPNYTFSYTAGSVSVTAAPLTATVTGSQTYGGTGRAFALAGVSGFVNGQGASLVNGTLSGCASSATAATGVGPHSGTISGCGGLSAPNYSIGYADGGFTVNKAPLTITASSATIPYGAAVPAISASYSGFVNGETSTAVSTPPTCSTTYTVGAGPGTFPSSCTGAVAANYSFVYVPGMVTVTGGPTTLTYTGVQQVTQKSSFTPSATLSSTAGSCVAGQTVTFALNVNPTNGAAGPYSLGSAKTTSSGTVTAPAVSTSGWQLGGYTVTATFVGTPGCLASAATGALAVTTPGLAANGGGKYAVSGAGPVTFAFEAAKAGSRYVGQVSLVNDHRWMFVGSVSNYVKTTTTAGYTTGTGSLYWWNPTLNHGCGGWVLAASNDSYAATFGATTRTSPGTFGIQISYTPTSSQPGPLPNSAPQTLAGGLIGLL
jgi:hypothetical protein